MDKAVALKYTHELPAPFIIAKGKGELARKIKAIADANGISIVENRILTEGMIELELGSFIPEEYYEIIAKIFVFVAKFGV
ncbi:MAG: EscU/YscU/HrcU family type III secretion system export apparatus switch protein [Spirochaetales bacterium]|nr:EscU/YscU/HrcU family type III secretion system export apparatus switch protein [Spirochaetales bacterium]